MPPYSAADACGPNAAYRQVHTRPDLTAVLLVNLGTPEDPGVPAVRRYLAEFLSDPRVIEWPRWLWWPLLHGVILRVRPRRSAHAYARIWTPQGSPLRQHTLDLAKRLDQHLNPDKQKPLTVLAAMRYGTPSIPQVLGALKSQGLRHLLVLPLYPQYSATTTASVFDAVVRELAGWRWVPELRFVTDYAGDPHYLDALCAHIGAYREQHGTADRLLFSFHGLPQRYVRQGDPYYCQCLATARRVTQRLGLSNDQWGLSFQSRVGREPWLKPDTDAVLRQWGGDGVRSVQVVCPGFAVDCLETLEEVAMQGRDAFMAAGGQEYAYIPALNAGEGHVHALTQLVRARAGDWPALDSRTTGDFFHSQSSERQARFLASSDPFDP